MHNNQGQTIEKAMIDVAKSLATAGMTSVCFSRVKRLVDLLVGNRPFDRLSNLGNNLILKIRLEEEVRLEVLAVETLLRHGVRNPSLVAIIKSVGDDFFCVFAIEGVWSEKVY